MEIVTEGDVIRGVAAAWDSQYVTWSLASDRQRSISDRLRKVNLNTATAADIADIIGNDSWTRLNCDECGKDTKCGAVLGEDQDYESATAFICADCILDVARLIKERDSDER